MVVTDGIVIFNFELFFAFYTANSPKKENYKKKKKKEKNVWIYHFIYVYQKLQLDNIQFLRFGARRTNRWTKKVTRRGRCPT